MRDVEKTEHEGVMYLCTLHTAPDNDTRDANMIPRSSTAPQTWSSKGAQQAAIIERSTLG